MAFISTALLRLLFSPEIDYRNELL